ncbi:MAG: hypothetical protein AAGL24_22925 [Pseudomonadota bacterium]
MTAIEYPLVRECSNSRCRPPLSKPERFLSRFERSRATAIGRTILAGRFSEFSGKSGGEVARTAETERVSDLGYRPGAFLQFTGGTAQAEAAVKCENRHPGLAGEQSVQLDMVGIADRGELTERRRVSRRFKQEIQAFVKDCAFLGVQGIERSGDLPKHISEQFQAPPFLDHQIARIICRPEQKRPHAFGKVGLPVELLQLGLQSGNPIYKTVTILPSVVENHPDNKHGRGFTAPVTPDERLAARRKKPDLVLPHGRDLVSFRQRKLNAAPQSENQHGTRLRVPDECCAGMIVDAMALGHAQPPTDPCRSKRACTVCVRQTEFTGFAKCRRLKLLWDNLRRCHLLSEPSLRSFAGGIYRSINVTFFIRYSQSIKPGQWNQETGWDGRQSEVFPMIVTICFLVERRSRDSHRSRGSQYGSLKCPGRHRVPCRKAATGVANPLKSDTVSCHHLR